jgi:hypothetical protein
MNSIALGVIGVICWISLIRIGFKRGLEIDALARQVSRSNIRREIAYEMLPRKMRGLIEKQEADLAAAGFRRFCCYDNEFMRPGHRGSFSAIYLNDDLQTAFAFSYIVMPRILWLPTIPGKFPLIVPWPEKTGELTSTLCVQTMYKSGGACCVMTMPALPEEWWPSDVQVSNLPRNASAAELLEAHDRETNRFIIKHSPEPITFHSVDDYLQAEDRLQKKLDDYGERKMNELLSDQGIDRSNL